MGNKWGEKEKIKRCKKKILNIGERLDKNERDKKYKKIIMKL